MAHIFKVVLRAENHSFELWQNKANSVSIIVYARHKSDKGIGKQICSIDRKSNAVTWEENILHTFKKETIEKLSTQIGL